MLSKMQSQPLI